MHADDALERRIVTVLFADLVGFTTLSEEFDAEDVAVIQDRYFAAVRDTVGRYGGRLEKFIGDAAMAVFGVPRARDDDAERAVRAGMALIHAVQQLGAELGLDEDALRLRVGVNSGEAVVAASGSDEGRITGDTVNVAARLQTAAPPGGLLIGESTALAVADVAELGDQQLLELKGKSAPVGARLVTGFRPEPSREQAMGGLKAPTVGRVAEIETFQQALLEAAAGRTDRWLVVAPPGVGKSRLLRELAEMTPELGNFTVLRARSRSGAVSPFEAIAGLIRAVLPGDLARDDTSAAVRASLVATGSADARAALVAELCTNLVWPRDTDARARQAGEDRDALFGAWLDGLDALAGDACQLWLVEDAHWAGGDVLAFLGLAGSRAAPHGRLVIESARPSLLEAQSVDGTDRSGPWPHVMRLDTLQPTDATELVGALVGDALPGELVERIVERSDGNCLFIEELLRTWVSVGTLVPDDDGWRLAVAADEVALPQSVQAIYSAQLDDLPPDARRLARRASVAGRRFPLRALDALDAPDDGLEPLRRRELISGPLPEILLGDAFSYRHALLRDAGYASLARAERSRLHVRLARWLEEAAGDRSAEVAEQIAGHYAAALESTPKLATTVGEGLDREQTRELAASWHEQAGQAALVMSAHDAARTLFRRAIELAPQADAMTLGRRWERLADATAFAADMSEGGHAYELALGHYRNALAEARTAPAIASVARATSELAGVWYQQLRFTDSRDLAGTVLAELPDADPGSRARLLMARAFGSMGSSGASDQSAADITLAVELADQTDDEELKLRAHKSRTGAETEGGRADAASWLDIAERAARLGLARDVVDASTNAAIYSVDDAPRNVAHILGPARELAIAHGYTEEIGWIAYLDAEVAFAAGDWDRALEHCAATMDIGEANDYLRLTVRTIHVAVPIGAARADRGVLERCARWYLSLEGKFDFPDSPYSRVIRTAQDLDLAESGLWPDFMPEVESRIVSFGDDANLPSWAAAVDRVVRAWVAAGELDGAQRAIEAMAAAIAASRNVAHLGRGTLELMRGRVAAARHERAAASAAGRLALDHFRISAAPWWMAKAIRLLERSDSADERLVVEAALIERRLRAAFATR